MKTLPRLVGAALAERLRVMPAVVLTGARQTIEAGGTLLPIEVKATARPRVADCAHLRTFRAE